MISVIIHHFLHLASERLAGSPFCGGPFDARCSALWESSVSFTYQFPHYLPRSSVFHFTLCLVLCLVGFHFPFPDLAPFYSSHFVSLFLKQWTADNRVKYGPHCKMPFNGRNFLLAVLRTLSLEAKGPAPTARAHAWFNGSFPITALTAHIVSAISHLGFSMLLH